MHSESTGSGDLSVTESGGAAQLLDARPWGFWARVTNYADSAYAFTRCDDGKGDGTYPDQAGTTEYGDGATLVAWEVNQRTDVPTGAKVWLQPNRLGPGFTFEYAPPGGEEARYSRGRVFAAKIRGGPDSDGLYRWVGLKVTADGTGWEEDGDNPDTGDYTMRPVDVAGTGPGDLEVDDRVIAWASPAAGYYECAPDVYATATKDGLVSRAAQTWDGSKTTLVYFEARGTYDDDEDVTKAAIGIVLPHGEGPSGIEGPGLAMDYDPGGGGFRGVFGMDSFGNVLAYPANPSGVTGDFGVVRATSGLPNDQSFCVIEPDGTKRRGLDFRGGLLRRWIGGIGWKDAGVVEVDADYTVDLDDGVVLADATSGNVTVTLGADRPAGSVVLVVRTDDTPNTVLGTDDHVVYVEGGVINGDPSGTAYVLTGMWEAALIVSYGSGNYAIAGLHTPNLLRGGIGGGSDVAKKGQLLWWDDQYWRRLDPPGADGTYSLQLVVGGAGTTFTFSWV